MIKLPKPAERPSEVVVGIDFGTTAVKAVAFGVDAEWRAVEEREYPLLSPAPDWQEQDPATVVAAGIEALAACARSIGNAKVLGISVSTAMHGLIALDEGRRPLTPLITWADGRAAAEAGELHASGVAASLHRETGTPVHPLSPLTKIMWLRRHAPDVAARTRWWVGLKDFVLMHLTGRLVTELSSASATGMLSMKTRAWSSNALDVCGVSIDDLPEVLPTTALLALSGDAASAVGLQSGTPVVAGAADGPLANLGIGALGPGQVGISLGTSGAARVAVSEPAVDEAGALFCYALTDTCWVVGGAISNGGSVVPWAGRALAPDLGGDDEAILALAASAPPGCDGLVMLPYLFPERAPLWDPALPGAYIGLRSSHTRAHMARAAIEGVCFQLAAVVRALEKVQPVAELRVTGGALRSALWRASLAAVLGRPLRVVSSTSGTALGAAALGLYALGRVGELAEGALVLDPASRSGELVAPDPELVEVYARAAGRIPVLLREVQRAAEVFRTESDWA